MQDAFVIIMVYKIKGTISNMKPTLTAPALLLIAALAFIVESPIVLGLVVFGFFIDSVLNQVLISSMEASSDLKDFYIEHLQGQLAGKKSDE